jgi:hypothetical protein
MSNVTTSTRGSDHEVLSEWCLALEPQVLSNDYRASSEKRVLRLIREIIQNRQKPACCAMCFRIVSNANRLQTTGSHVYPNRVWKIALGQDHVFDDESEGKKKGTKRLIAEYYFLCKHQAKNPVFDCEQGVLGPLEDSLAEFFTCYHRNKLSTADQELSYDARFRAGLSSVLYRTLLQHLLGTDEVHADQLLQPVSELLWELRKVMFAPLDINSGGLKVFVLFTHINDFYQAEDKNITADQWCRKQTLRTLSDVGLISKCPAGVLRYAHIASMSGMIVVGMTAECYRIMDEATNISRLGAEICPGGGSLTLLRNEHRRRAEGFWLEDSLLALDRRVAETRRFMPNWSDSPEGARAVPSTLNERIIILPRGMTFVGDVLTGSRKFSLVSHGSLPGDGSFKIYNFPNAPPDLSYLVLLQCEAQSRSQVISWYFSLVGDQVEFRQSSVCDAYTNSECADFEVQQARPSPGNRTMRLRDHCYDILVAR